MVLKRIMLWFSIFLVTGFSFCGCAKIQDPVKETSKDNIVMKTEKKEYERYSCELYYPELEQMLEFFGLLNEKCEKHMQEHGSITENWIIYKNGGYVVATEDRKGVRYFRYIRNKKDEQVCLYDDSTLPEEDRTQELDFMTLRQAENACREELKRLGISAELTVKEAYGISETCIKKMYGKTGGQGFGKKEQMTKEREAYRFCFQILCDGVPFYDKEISKGVLEGIQQPQIEMTYSVKGIETFFMDSVVIDLNSTGHAKMIGQKKAEDIVLKAYGQEGEGQEEGVITGAEVVYARVPVKIRVGKGNLDLSEYECIPCWKITMSQKITWMGAEYAEIVTYEYLLQGDTGVRL